MFSSLRLAFPTKLYTPHPPLSSLYRVPQQFISFGAQTVPFGNIQRGRRIPIPVGTSGSTAFTRNISSGRPKRILPLDPKRPKAAFYAVRKGRVPGIYDTWDEAEQQVLRYVGAIHKKFRSRAEAEAFIGQGGAASQDPYTIPETGSEEKLSAPPVNSKTRIWAVKVGRTPGIYKTWEDAEKQVEGFPGAAYESFANRALAERYMNGSGRRGKQSRATPFQVHAARASTRPSLSSLPGDGSAITLSPVYQLAQSQGFTITRDGHLVVYTDGSSQGNGGKMAKAGSGVWWAAQGHASTLNLAERLPGLPQTNNRAELLAIIRAIETCPFPELPLEIRTDSRYSISCMTKFLPAWMRNDFHSTTGQPIKNKDMIVHLLALLNQRSQDNKVKFWHVKAHVGETGNEGADVLANTGAEILDIPPDRTDWFTLEDANRFKAANSSQPTGSLDSATLSSSNTESHDNSNPEIEDSVTGGVLQDIAPIEVEVDPSWLLTEEDIAELEADI